MTVAYLETSSRTLPNEVVLIVAIILCQLGTVICDGMFGVLGPRCWTGSSMLDCHLIEGVWYIYMIGILGSLY